MSMMKTASMASVAMIMVLGIAMLDSAVPDSFFEALLTALLAALTIFFGYRLFIAVRAVQARAKTHPIPQNEFRGILALGAIVVIMGVADIYLIVSPEWDGRVIIAGGFIVFLVFLISRMTLQVNLLELIGNKDDSSR